jgi:hypothetical protein
MATQVYGSGADSSAGANTVKHFYDRAGINAANAVNVYGQFADKNQCLVRWVKHSNFKVLAHV